MRGKLTLLKIAATILLLLGSDVMAAYAQGCSPLGKQADGSYCSQACNPGGPAVLVQEGTCSPWGGGSGGEGFGSGGCYPLGRHSDGSYCSQACNPGGPAVLVHQGSCSPWGGGSGDYGGGGGGDLPQCPGNSQWNGTQCVCPAGTTWDGYNCVNNSWPTQEPQCPGNSQRNGTQCVCPAGTTWDGYNCVSNAQPVPQPTQTPQQCPGNSQWNGAQCVCPANTTWDGSTCAPNAQATRAPQPTLSPADIESLQPPQDRGESKEEDKQEENGGWPWWAYLIGIVLIAGVAFAWFRLTGRANPLGRQGQAAPAAQAVDEEDDEGE